MEAKADFAKWRLKTTDLSRDGKQVVFTADEAQRKVIAAELSLRQLDALELHLTAWPWGRGGIKLVGELTASLVQTCVVTFKPVAEDLAERFVRTYLPQRELDSLENKLGLLEPIEIELEAEDPPEPLSGTQIDLLPIVVEELSLALDPYPRHPDAELVDLPQESVDEKKPNPFAVLRDFKTGSKT